MQSENLEEIWEGVNITQTRVQVQSSYVD